ncbi:calcium/sodium antiporter [Reinekea blandensis]|uniref:K+-dependent Na+/Ca+ exchanger related-protein n=1 Tax=Reinekea blandensis MED297 TaxID=314283 RepID=A4BC83_9GAMM|nr:calcium/sodium antiporter [Reinekea blandensis]EAR10149.1 K+-dependent Na+/Ca+ exchanger related-protein [Reinekea sp. MED297] [Reinekea blandensis MED297]
MLMFSLAILVGLIFLVLSADRFVAGAAALANNLGVPHLIIGVTIVSLGTSAPEIIAAIFAALEGRIELAMGNAIGSNVANIGLVLGITALVAPIPVSKRLVGNENLIMFASTLMAGALLFNLYLSAIDGLVLLLLMVAFLVWIYWEHNRTEAQEDDEFEEDIPSDMSTVSALVWFAIGLGVLIVSARVLVWGAVGIADMFQISEAVIGATIIAVGTSLPELAASVASALKKHHDIAIGNVLGSNIFNILAVLSVPGLIAPGAFDAEVFNLHYLFMLAISACLFFCLIALGRSGKPMGRYIGTVFVLMYATFGWIVFQAATV